jgi:TolB-like protein
VSPPTRIWRWSRRNPKLVGAGFAGLLLGAAAVWLFHGEIFRAPPFNPSEKSIAVLPFVNLSTIKDQQYLGDGISEEILHTLAGVDGLRVVGRSSSFSFKGDTNARDVGEKLNVGNVLEGSLRREANRVRVTAELIDTRSGFRLWTESYDRELDGAFALQDEIARSIVDALKIKLAVRVSAHEQPGNGVYDPYLQRLLTDVTHPTGINSIGISVPLQNPFSPSTILDYTSPGDLDSRHPNTRANAAPPETGFTTERTPRHIDNSVTAASPGMGSTTSVPHRALEAGLRTNKITADGPAFIQGFVKDAKGEPIKGADLGIESRDGKQVFSTVKTDPKGRYVSQGLPPGVYRVTLRVNGAVKASITNTQANANQPTQLNFDFKPTSQARNIAKGRKHMVWMPARTGSHLGGNWVEADDSGKADSGLNVQTVTVRRW